MVVKKSKSKSSENAKIKNATHVKCGSIEFKSKLEYTVYKTLIEAGFKPVYEKRTYTLIDSFKPTVLFFTKNKTKDLHLDNKTIRKTTYTPDFTFRYKGYFVIVEAKGVVNDVYPLKKKLFRQVLERTAEFEKILFFEVYSKTNVLQMIDVLKEL